MLYVTSHEQAKKSARALERFARKEGFELSQGQALDAVSVLAGSEDWNALAAALNCVRGLPVSANVVLALSLSRVLATLPRAVDSLTVSGLDAAGRKAVSTLSCLHERVSDALKTVAGSVTTVDELYLALADLTEAVGALPDGSLPDRFNYRALTDAKIALSASKPEGYEGRQPDIRHGGAPGPAQLNRPEPGSQGHPLVDTSTYRLFYSGAETKDKRTSWSVELLLAKPGQRLGDVAREALTKRDPRVNLDNVAFWFTLESPHVCGGFSVCLSDASVQHAVDSLAGGVELAENLSTACNRTAHLRTRTTGVLLAEFEPS